jgi:putative ABC transport system permease protein
MEIGPIARALLRNKLGALLIAAQIAFTMTVIINAVFIINERSRLMARPSGLDEGNLFHVMVLGYGDDYNEAVVMDDDLAMLRQLPGVVNATSINAIPVSGGGSSTGIRAVDNPDQPSVATAIYRADEQVMDTLGLNLIAGVGLTGNDVVARTELGETEASKALMTEALARQLYPDLAIADVVGLTAYLPGSVPVEIVGIIERLQAPWPMSSFIENSIIVPEVFLDSFSRYMIRTEAGQRDRLMAEAEERLVAQPFSRVVRELQSLEQTRADSYRVDSTMSTMLWVVIGTLIFINSMGIVGLAVFSINRRRKQIGTRRALGATKLEILRYFLLENLFITIAGVTVGAVLTIAFSIVLTQTFNMPPMAWYYTPLGALALVMIGQLAAFGPSSRAAGIAPAIATRSV